MVVGIIILAKVFGIAIVLVLLRGLQVQLGIGVAMLVLLHAAGIAALVVYLVRRRTRHGRGKRHEHATAKLHTGWNHGGPAASGPADRGDTRDTT
ncbi:hypothetical protein EP51_44765 (plasmid) [Rhodococcus opacus]|uniref:Uncharacterized protein n=2 Tax=Rhodococcus opacus TaxID=37919 RepID=A0A076EYV7_RHOOP|nr:hypothetical protein EP51_44765 [Rhodococcus opacus]